MDEVVLKWEGYTYFLLKTVNLLPLLISGVMFENWNTEGKAFGVEFLGGNAMDENLNLMSLGCILRHQIAYLTNFRAFAIIFFSLIWRVCF